MAATIQFKTVFGAEGSTEMEFPVEVIAAAGMEWIQVSDGDRVGVARRCTPDSPFYTRWINRLGGYDYWMWERRKEFDETISDLVNVQKYDGGQETIYAEGFTYVTVGDQLLERDVFDSLKELARSPVIEWWCEDLQKWFRVVLEKEHSSVWDTGKSLGSIEYTFQLPRLNLQF